MNPARTPIVVVGAGGHGRETALLIAQIDAVTPTWELLGFLDDAEALHGRRVAGLAVLGGLAVLDTLPPSTCVALGMGAPTAKRAVMSRIGDRRFPALVHPAAIVGERVTIGAGAQVHAGTIITCDVTIGRGVTINRHCDISHDDVIGDFSTLAPAVSLAGNVHLDVDVDVGLRACCIPGVRVGARTVIGAGAVVVRDLPADVIAVGIPARPRPASVSRS